MFTEVFTLQRESGKSFLIRYSRVFIETAHKAWMAEHRHTEIEVGLYLKGSGKYRSGAKLISFQPGDILVFGSNVDHIIDSISSDTDIDLINLHIDPLLLLETQMPAVVQGNLRSFVSNLANNALKIQGSDPRNNEIQTCVESIIDDFSNQRKEFGLSIYSSLIRILIQIMRHTFDCDEAAEQLNNAVHPFSGLSEIVDYIQNNLHEQLTLDQIAQEAHISRSYLCSLFKESFGMTLWEYITIRRVDLAIDYLLNTQQSITQISAHSGFNTLANFNRAFRKITGQAPSEYRKKGRYYH